MKKRVLILGASGMLGNTLFRLLPGFGYRVTGWSRTPGTLGELNYAGGIDAQHFETVERVLRSERPDVVINCVGIIKQLDEAKDSIQSIEINALFPHRLAKVCGELGTRLVHLSTDCVFSGRKGSYAEGDLPDCDDLYGRSKLLGEVDYPHAVTLRTSIIGHELSRSVSLIDWFLSQEGTVRGFTNAIYSGFPTVEMARIIAEFVIPNQDLRGLYQVASEPISKYDLLCVVREIYGRDTLIEPYDDFRCDRSLSAERFCLATGYRAPAWPDMVRAMYRDYLQMQSLKQGVAHV